MLAQLAEVTALLGDDDPLAARLIYRSGALIAVRGLGAAALPGDREEAERLLRTAREGLRGQPGPDGARAAFFLVLIMKDKPGYGQEVDQAGTVDWALANGAQDFNTRLEEFGLLSAEAYPVMAEMAASLDPEGRGEFEALGPLMQALRGGFPQAGGDFSELLRLVPEGSPMQAAFQAVLPMMEAMGLRPFGTTGTPEPEDPDGASDPAGRTVPEAAVRPPEAVERDTALTLGLLGTAVPGSVNPETLRRQMDAVDSQLRDLARQRDGAEPPDRKTTPSDIALGALGSTMAKVTSAMGAGDLGSLDAVLRVLHDATGAMPADDELTEGLNAVRPLILGMGGELGKNLQDSETGRQLLESAAARLAALPPAANLDSVRFRTMFQCMVALTRAEQAKEAGDGAALAEIITELEELLSILPENDFARFQLLLVHSRVMLAHGSVTDDQEELIAAARLFDQTVGSDSAPAFMRPWLRNLQISAATLRADLESSPELLRRSLDDAHGDGSHDPSAELPPNLRTHQRLGIGYGRTSLFHLTKDPAELDRAIAELEKLREEVWAGEGSRQAAEGLWQLARAYQSRWALAQDLHSATRAAGESLRFLAADVLLQSGAEHGLRAARDGAVRATTAASWASSHGWFEEAVATLELGRAMVLHAAAASAAVPELLDARGHPALADAWREHEADGGDAGDAGNADLVTELPSSLRRQALEALGYQDDGPGQGPFTAPTVEELRAAVAAADADALVYLVPTHGSAPGTAIVLGPDIKPGSLALPLLIGDRARPLEAYLDAAAARSRLPADAGPADRKSAEQAWEKALEELCDWAWPAVMGPVLTGLAEALAANPDRRKGRPGPPRLILVPCGTLGVVPWHAARFLRGPGKRAHCCELAIISYAASGSQFLRTVARSPVPAASAPALIADPRMDLTRAEQEVAALHEAFYRKAALYGEFYEPPAPTSGTGTPDEVLELLSPAASPAGPAGPAPLSLLHIASHASAGMRPTVSALKLAFPAGTEELPPEQGGPGSAPDLGMLTVSRLLDERRRAPVPKDSGPLVVLSACETDLSTRDHDEALTLATAFVARGARDVVGSRWSLQDSSSAVLMAVFHHHLTVEGLPPADALRAAQLWMLAPDREPPPSLSGELLREAARPGLERLPAWAAFIHQGHPGPARPPAAGPDRAQGRPA
ncbi:CHAT domain-containing protein [Streptomyces tsukubensis]|uniref:CHAT domain-containing protein n=1 Tax=Streptomyces tsukubensis TaxID=83656 RepID=UPI0036CDB9CE